MLSVQLFRSIAPGTPLVPVPVRQTDNMAELATDIVNSAADMIVVPKAECTYQQFQLLCSVTNFQAENRTDDQLTSASGLSYRAFRNPLGTVISDFDAFIKAARAVKGK